MTTLYGGRDRTKAYEHAIFLCREVNVPIDAVARALPQIAERLRGKLLLDLARAAPAVPLELAIAPSLEASDWRIDLRLARPHLRPARRRDRRRRPLNATGTDARTLQEICVR